MMNFLLKMGIFQPAMSVYSEDVFSFLNQKPMGHNFASTEYVMLLHCEVNATLYTSWRSFGVSPPREKWHGVVEIGGE